MQVFLINLVSWILLIIQTSLLKLTSNWVGHKININPFFLSPSHPLGWKGGISRVRLTQSLTEHLPNLEHWKELNSRKGLGLVVPREECGIWHLEILLETTLRSSWERWSSLQKGCHYNMQLLVWDNKLEISFLYICVYDYVKLYFNKKKE